MKSPAILLTTILFTLSTGAAYAQEDGYDYFYNNQVDKDEPYVMETDLDLFNISVANFPGDVFAAMSSFNFSAVRYNRRGYTDSYTRYMYGNNDMMSLINRRPDYSSLSNIRRAGIVEDLTSGTALIDGLSGAIGGSHRYTQWMARYTREGGNVSLYGYDRKGRLGAKASYSGSLGSRTHYLLWASRRWGTDPHIDGVFTDETSFLASVVRSVGMKSELSFMITGSASENGLRSYSVQEAFDLTGNNLYNPSWGDHDGDVRSTKTVKRFQPLSTLHFRTYFGKTELNASAAYRFGKEKYSGLSWFRTYMPYADYYRNLPSYFTNSSAAQMVRDKWLMNDKRVTQVDWESLYEINYMSADGAAYVLHNRVEDKNDLQFNVSFLTRPDNRLTILYGARIMISDSRFYKQAASLLGGAPFYDYDQFLIGDEMFGDKLLNNMRDPGRKVSAGDTYGYDYSIRAAKYEGYTGMDRSFGDFNIKAHLSVAQVSFLRNGNYEKELFPGDLSYGRSEKKTFDIYDFKVGARYLLRSHQFSVTGFVSTNAPQSGVVFLDPEYTNYINPKAEPVLNYGGQVDYRFLFNSGHLKLSAYITRTDSESAVYTYWDDMGGFSGNMIISDMSKLFCGIEAGASFDLSSNFTLSIAAALSRNNYVSDVAVDILSNTTKQALYPNTVSYLDGYTIGGSPQTLLSAEISYNSKGWIASLTTNFMGDRYVDPNPLRRMERTYRMAGNSVELYNEFISQERLPNAFTIDIFLLKSFMLPRGSLSLLASVNNLLGKRDIIYSGYEQMRIYKKASGVNTSYTPAPSKYLYSYPRTFYCSVSYRF